MEFEILSRFGRRVVVDNVFIHAHPVAQVAVTHVGRIFVHAYCV